MIDDLQKNSIFKRWWFWLLLAIVVVLIGLGVVFYFLFRPQLKDIDPNNPPKFIEADFIDLSKVTTVSKFRSNQGHDFSDSYETCRSMKHYYGSQPPKEIMEAFSKNGKDAKVTMFQKEPDPVSSIDIYSPVNGKIISMSEETTPIGKQIHIVPDNAPGFVVRLFHVFPDENIKALSKVKAGQHIGLIHRYQSTDISVQYQYLNKLRFVSYFSVMTDEVLAKYIARGAISRDDFIVSKDYRDSHPLQCQEKSDDFVANQPGLNEESTINEFHLSGWVEQTAGPQVKDSEINDFYNCAKFYPVLETYPEQCKTPDGRTFTKQ